MARKPARQSLIDPESIEELFNFRLYLLTSTSLAGAGLMFLRCFGLSRREWRVIAYLGLHPGLRQNELAAKGQLDPAWASRIVSRLAAAGHVEKRRETDSAASAGDGRAVRLRLSVTGRALYRRCFAQVKEINRELLSGLTPAEIAAADRILARVTGNARAVFQRERKRAGPRADWTGVPFKSRPGGRPRPAPALGRVHRLL